MPDPTARLIASTRRRLILVTMSLIALLVLGIGAATAFVGLRALDADVDRALQVSVNAAVAALDGGLPQDAGETDDTVPAAADTFILYLDSSGTEVSNPSGIALDGLPDADALSAAAATGSDIRTVQAGGVPVRLLTEPIPSTSGASPIGYVQGGFVLTLHHQQSNSLVTAVVVVAVIGLIGAALVTLIVTGDALVPIRRSFAAQRQFVADASHELKTPPAIIRANAEVLEREALVTDEGRPFVTDIVTETERLSRLVGDLLQLASADATGLAITRDRIDLSEVATETVRQAQALASEHEVTLDLETPGDKAFVSGDRDRLVQLILILLDNAIDHAPPGTPVVVTVRRAARRVELAVVDQGPGVPPAERTRVFEPFTRLPGVRRDRAGGTGLGLAIARRIVLAHDGTIAVEDAPGGGAGFIVSLPAAPDRVDG